MPVQPHKHLGTDSPAIDAGDLIGPAVITSNLQVSAQRVIPSIVQRGSHTLSGNVKFVTFPQSYRSTNDLVVLATSKTTNPQFIDSIAVSGFTVSGSGTDAGYWLAMGYK